tara:strand:- start:214 stop:330 length:117 start_codon:yes stop_codon:yes gene_type:complete
VELEELQEMLETPEMMVPVEAVAEVVEDQEDILLVILL